MTRRHLPCLAAAALLASLSFDALRAQCDLQWTASGSLPGASGQIRAATPWDPDGPGPQPMQLVVGGEFSLFCDVMSPLVAMIDPQTGVCQALPGISSGYRVLDVATLDNGDLIVSGTFAIGGGTPVRDIVRWNGSGWTSLGSGSDADVLLPRPGGELLIAENTLPASTWVGRIRRWNGTSWTQVAPDVAGRIEALQVMPNGDLIAAGQFTAAGGVAANNVARWNGTAWAPLGLGVGSAATSSALLANGDLVVGGWFVEAGGQPANRIARWNGTTWSAMGAGVSAPAWPHVESLQVLANGDLLVGGTFDTADGAPANCVARWNGAWSAVGGGVDRLVQEFVEWSNGDVIAVGAFLEAEGNPAKSIARWNGASWSSFGGPTISDAAIPVTAVAANGDLLVGGDFTSIGGVAASGVARRTSSGWTALGGGVSGPVSGDVRAIAELPNGDLVVGGTMTSAGGVPVSNIALWNGTSWSSLGGGTNGGVLSLHVMADGTLVAGGYFTTAGGVPAVYIASWDGTAWSALGGGGVPQPVTHMTSRSNGDLIVSTAINPFLATIERWDGSSWSQVASLQTSAVNAMLTLPDDDVLVGGFLPGLGIQGLARWDGANWHGAGLMFGSSVSRMVLAPNGDLIASGNIVTNAMTATLARWNGSTWSALDYQPSAQDASLAMLPGGELVLGGSFQFVGGIVSPYLASLVAPCPAAAVTFGAGCVGSNGLNELVVDELPWLGGNWRSRATGMPNVSFVATVTGFTSLALPLNALWPQAGVGCFGYTTADHLDLALPVAGEVTSRIAVPSNPALIGAQLHQYALAFEFDLQGSLIAVTSTNGVSVTLGRF